MKCSLGAVQRCQLLILLLTITMGGMIMMAQATKETDAVSEEESLLFDFPRAKQPPKMVCPSLVVPGNLVRIRE